MSATTLESEKQVPEAETKRHRIPSQPVVNIGTSGHVDHGKCLTPDQFLLLGSSLVRGTDIIENLASIGTLLRTVDGGTVYSLSDNSVMSLNERFQPVKAESLFFLQNYSGPIYSIKGKSGRTISVTPEHPLLVNRGGNILWVKSKHIRQGKDAIAFVTQIPELPSKRFTSPFEKLAGDYNIVSFKDYELLVTLTNDFQSFSSLDLNQINKIRILSGLSLAKLSALARIDYERTRKCFSGQIEVSSSQKERMLSVLRQQTIPIIAPGEYVLESKKDGSIRSKIKDVDVDDDLAKWFAFVWSEGTSSASRVCIGQSVQEKMLQEFLAISRTTLGQAFKKVSTGNYQLNNRAFVDYLRIKFDYKPSNENACTISDWVLCLPAQMRATFLRWYFTLNGGFNNEQIDLFQSNERNVVVTAYLLQMFGIVPRFGTKIVSTKKGQKKYYRLTISSRANLRIFAQQIGFEDSHITKKLDSYLSSLKDEIKEIDFSIPVSSEVLRSLLKLSGLEKVGFGTKLNQTRTKKMLWYKAYESSCRTGAVARTKLLQIIDAVEDQLRNLEKDLAGLSSNKGLLELMSRARIAQEAALQMGLSRKALVANLKRYAFGSSFTLTSRTIVSSLVEEKIAQCRKLVKQLKLLANSPLMFDVVKAVDQRYYEGPIFDLTVPEYANFIAGNGAIVCHNTTMTQAITGVWTSAHSEELRRGITIKVGYADAAFYKCDNCPPPDCYWTSPVCEKCGGEAKLLRVVSFVDCPGHESLMANMLSGAAVMDGSILVIAANEKVPQPQTREHLQALQMLGMKHIVIAQNKVDLVTDKEAAQSYQAIKTFVAGSVAAGAPIIPISAQHKLNIDALIQAIEQNIPTPQRNEDAPPLMQVLRSFDVNHPGLASSQLAGGVVGGTLLQGSFTIGEEIEMRPGIIEEGASKAEPVKTKITALMSSAGKTDKVHPGGLIAVGTQLDPFYTRSDSLVGAIIGRPGELPPVIESLSMDVKLFDTAVGTQELVKVDKIRMQEILRLNIGTGVTVGIVSSSRDTVVDSKLKKPVCASKGDKIAISRRIGERWRLIGAGTVR